MSVTPETSKSILMPEDFRARKGGEPLVSLTAYTTPMAQMMDPHCDFVLVGDSGEQDPEVYAALIRKFPEQIKKIYIRNVTNEEAGNDRFNAVFGDIDPDRWLLFDSPAGLELPSSP